MKRIILFFLALGFVACTNKKTAKVTPVIADLPYHCKVVFLDAYYDAYLQAIRKDFDKKDSLYRKMIKLPIIHDYLATAAFAPMLNFDSPKGLADTTDFAKYIDAIKNNRDSIRMLIAAALEDCHKYLQNDSVTFLIQPANNSLKAILTQMGGVTGITFGSKQILLEINPAINSWQKELKDAVAHEFEHSYWIATSHPEDRPVTLLVRIIAEGRADHFAHLLYPDMIGPWDTALNDSARSALWDKIKAEIGSDDFAYGSQVLFGDEGSYPHWGGYTLGYSIVGSMLKYHPNLTPEQWAKLSPEEILRDSDYNK